MLVLSLPVARSASAGEPEQFRLESLREGDATRIAAYTLKVTLDKPANIIFRDQGNSITTCMITQGPAGFAASCKADELPKPVYHPPGTFNTQGMDYDDHGSLGVGMKEWWVTLRTKETNETYEEDRVLYVNPQGGVVDAGVSRTLNRYPPDDRGICSWSYTQLHRVWWGLGHGIESDLMKVEGDVSESGNLNRMRIRGSLGGFPGGVWKMSVEKPPTRLIREATFIRDVDLRPVVEVATKGARQFDDVTLAEEGSVRLPINDGGDAIETRVVLQDFNASFDDQLFAEVKRTLENLGGEEVQVVDYRSNPKNPSRSTLRLPAQRGANDK
jgi:hypothetical protein